MVACGGFCRSIHPFSHLSIHSSMSFERGSKQRKEECSSTEGSDDDSHKPVTDVAETPEKLSSTSILPRGPSAQPIAHHVHIEGQYDNLQNLVTAFQEKDVAIRTLLRENKTLHRRLAKSHGVDMKRARREDNANAALPPNVLLSASPSEIKQLCSQVKYVVATDGNGVPNIHIQPEGHQLSDVTRLLNFTTEHVKRPSVGDKAIVTHGKHYGQHVTVLDLYNTDNTAIIKVERMTKSEKESNGMLKETNSDAQELTSFLEQDSDDEMSNGILNADWQPSQVKADIPIKMLAVRR